MAAIVKERRIERLLVATDFSAVASRAVERAARLPLRPQATLHLLHVLPERLPARLRANAETEARRLLREAARSAAAAARAADNRHLSIEPIIVPGQPHEAILKEARRRRAGLIVLGRHGHRPIRDLFFGSTAERVIRHSEAPVLVVALKPDRPYHRPLVGLDLVGGEPSPRATVELALSLTAPLLRRVILVHAFDIPFEGRLRSALPQEALTEYRKQWRASAAARLHELRTSLEMPPGLLKTVLRAEAPATAILREANRRQVDLIALGSQRRTGVARALLGSVVAEVIRFAPCDVVIRPPAQDSRPS